MSPKLEDYRNTIQFIIQRMQEKGIPDKGMFTAKDVVSITGLSISTVQRRIMDGQKYVTLPKLARVMNEI